MRHADAASTTPKVRIRWRSSKLGRMESHASASHSPRTAFVFAGGGSLGAVQVGMLKALMRIQVRPDFIVGASVGAINGAYFAAEPDATGVARLERIWSRLHTTDVFPFSICLLYTSPSPRDRQKSRMPSSA